MEGKTQSAAQKDRYLAHLAHELRTPLTAVIGYAEAMGARTFGPLDDRYAEYADIIAEAGRHMLELAEDLLARTRIDAAAEASTIEPFDAAEPIAWALRLMAMEAQAAGVSLRFTPPTSPLRMNGDRRALAQMAVNLVANALRFTPSGGMVTVTLEARKGIVRLTVSDTGSGLAPGSETSGTGLQLVREFAETAGGTLSFGGAPDGGTVVTILLPETQSAP